VYQVGKEIKRIINVFVFSQTQQYLIINPFPANLENMVSS